jgi:murein L,D-transpeptidase YcbB/YkuD
VRISSKAADSSNLPLLKKLYQLGITDTLATTVTKNKVQASLRKAQLQFDLVSDGVLGKATLGVLNISLQQRLEELRGALNTLRWLEDIKQTQNALILNIPSANFMLYEKGRMVLSSKVIVGKASTPTPTLASTITEVILYPYWNVPHKIATRELLPRIKRNIGYLQSGNYQVLNKQGKVLNPYQINWHALSPGYFPYLIRQSTGCDNALGIVKFNFYNPFTVYLHDTPTKTLFQSNRRFFSHGCMRVEKPIDLAHFLLGFNRIAIDTMTEQGCLNSQSPIVVKVEDPLPVFILYSTVWYTQEGEIRFYDDVYKRQARIDPQNVAWLLKPVSDALVKTKKAISHHP